MSSAAKKSYFYAGDGAAEFSRLATQAKAMFAEEAAILQGLGLKPGHTCIDAGCGPGFLTMQLSQVVGNGKLFGYDIDPKLIAMAKQNCANLGNTEIAQASVYQLPRAEQSADFVYSRFVFSHLDQPQKALQEFKRVLRPGGTAAVLDVDDGMIICHPEQAEFKAVIEEAMVTQTNNGGDRLVGRKLGELFHTAGFRDVQVASKTFVTSNAATIGFFDIFVDGRLDYVSEPTRQRFQKIRPALNQAFAERRAWVFMPVLYAFGRV